MSAASLAKPVVSHDVAGRKGSLSGAHCGRPQAAPPGGRESVAAREAGGRPVASGHIPTQAIVPLMLSTRFNGGGAGGEHQGGTEGGTGVL
jgi:hypothetical protein